MAAEDFQLVGNLASRASTWLRMIMWSQRAVGQGNPVRTFFRLSGVNSNGVSQLLLDVWRCWG